MPAHIDCFNQIIQNDKEERQNSRHMWTDMKEKVWFEPDCAVMLLQTAAVQDQTSRREARP